MPAICPQSQIRANFQNSLRRPLRGLGENSHNAAIFLDQFRDLGLHAQMKLRVSLCLFRDEVQEIPLRHQRDEFAVRRQVRKVGDDHADVLDLAAELGQFLMRPAQELIENSKLVHQFQGRGMNRVSAKVTQEIRVLLQDHNIHTSTREQEPRNHPRRSPAHHTAASSHLLNGKVCSFHRESSLASPAVPDFASIPSLKGAPPKLRLDGCPWDAALVLPKDHMWLGSSPSYLRLSLSSRSSPSHLPLQRSSPLAQSPRPQLRNCAPSTTLPSRYSNICSRPFGPRA